MSTILYPKSMKPVNVTNAEYKNEFKIFLKFDDGVAGIVDLNDH